MDRVPILWPLLRLWLRYYGHYGPYWRRGYYNGFYGRGFYGSDTVNGTIDPRLRSGLPRFRFSAESRLFA